MTEDERMLEDLIREEWPKLRRFFYTKVPESEILDLVQQTMLAFVEGKDRIKGSPRAYLRGIAHFQVLKLYEKRRASSPFDSAIHTALDVGPTFSSRLDTRSKVVKALHLLPLAHQTAFELRYFEELSLEEVASALDVSLATAKRYIAAAETKVREALGSEIEAIRKEYDDL